MLDPVIRAALQAGCVIPAHPLALNHHRQLDEPRQRALSRYYLAAGAGGLAVGVHTTQFAIHRPELGLYEPVLRLAAEEMDRHPGRPVIRVAGIVGKTQQAVREANVSRELGYHAGLLSLAGLTEWSIDRLLDHCRAVGEVIPLFGFYLQPAVGGVDLPIDFWRRLAELESLVAIKIAAFDRYRTLEVIRAMVEVGRDDVALYTGNDDHLVLDLITAYCFPRAGGSVKRRMVGGLLGHWAVWTHRAVDVWRQCQRVAEADVVPASLLTLAEAITDCNAAIFDAAHQFRGCIPGILEVLRRQQLLAGTWCLDPSERLSPGQAEEIDRVCRDYPDLSDDSFVAEHLDQWQSPGD